MIQLFCVIKSNKHLFRECGLTIGKSTCSNFTFSGMLDFITQSSRVFFNTQLWLRVFLFMRSNYVDCVWKTIEKTKKGKNRL